MLGIVFVDEFSAARGDLQLERGQTSIQTHPRKWSDRNTTWGGWCAKMGY